MSHPGGIRYEHLVGVAALLAEWGADEDLQAAGLCHVCYGTGGYGQALLALDGRAVLRALRDFFAGAGERLTAAARQARTAQHAADPAGSHGEQQPVPVVITGLDHLVLTVADLDQASGFYQRVLGMRPVTFGAGRRALEFGTSKINLHRAGQEIAPRAARPVPGSADLCLLTTTPPGQVLVHLSAQHVPVEEGPVARTGARGMITSIYVRDPDGNLIEIASYPDGTPGGQVG